MHRIYALIPHSNNSYAFRAAPHTTRAPSPHEFLLPKRDGVDFPHVRRCRECENILDKWNTPLHGFTVVRRQLDCGLTHDGIYVVSQRFKEACEHNHIVGLEFEPLPDDPGFFSLRASRSVQVDAARRNVRFSKQCATCKQFDEVTGATPVFVLPGEIIGELECVRTDLEYACHDEKGFMLLCGEQAASILRGERLNGLVIQEQRQ
jgi:hypothetical protein